MEPIWWFIIIFTVLIGAGGVLYAYFAGSRGTKK